MTFNRTMGKLFSIVALALGLFLVMGSNAQASELEFVDLIGTGVQESEIIIRDELSGIIIGGGRYDLSPLSRGTAANPTVTTGNGRFWQSWPRTDRIQSNHSNPRWHHNATACNRNSCVSSNNGNWRAPNSTGAATAWAYAHTTGNSTWWNIRTHCNTEGCFPF